MKKLSKQQLTDLSAEMFEYHESENVFYATEDGSFFIESNKSAAQLHGRENDLKVVKFEREGGEEDVDQDELPSQKWTKDKIKAWLTEKEIPFDEKDAKPKLLEIINTALN